MDNSITLNHTGTSSPLLLTHTPSTSSTWGFTHFLKYPIPSLKTLTQLENVLKTSAQFLKENIHFNPKQVSKHGGYPTRFWLSFQNKNEPQRMRLNLPSSESSEESGSRFGSSGSCAQKAAPNSSWGSPPFTSSAKACTNKHTTKRQTLAELGGKEVAGKRRYKLEKKKNCENGVLWERLSLSMAEEAGAETRPDRAKIRA